LRGLGGIFAIVVHVVLVSLYDQNVFLFFLSLFVTICVIHFIVIFIRLVARVVRKLKSNM
jgi:hypothetical protein